MSYDFTGLSVLLVDDNRHMRVLVRRLLSAFGVARVAEAADGGAAWADLFRALPDVVLIDFAMEPVDGIEFTRRIRTAPDSPNSYLPIIMMTGYTEKTRVVEARDAGVTELVAKPVSALSLYNRLVAVVERPRPFVRAPGFFGPDRRRRQAPFKGPERRVGQTPLGRSGRPASASAAGEAGRGAGSGSRADSGASRPPGPGGEDFLEI
ncbi:MAG: response regulator [Marivibrio sp.]|uniref:response regulator n=1 Tax=Marivibrio sp. TaxID=2039719 RepID=UPI0032EED42D